MRSLYELLFGKKKEEPDIGLQLDRIVGFTELPNVETRSAELQLKPEIRSPEEVYKKHEFISQPPHRPQWERNGKSKMKLNKKQIHELRNSGKITQKQSEILESKHIDNEDSLIDLGVDVAIASLIVSELSNDSNTSFSDSSLNDTFKDEAFQGGESGGGGAGGDFTTPEDSSSSTSDTEPDSFDSSDGGSGD